MLKRLLHAKLCTLKRLCACEQLTLSTYPFFPVAMFGISFRKHQYNATRLNVIRQHINMSHWDFQVFTSKLAALFRFRKHARERIGENKRQTDTFQNKTFVIDFLGIFAFHPRLATILHRNQNFSSLWLKFFCISHFFGVLSLT